MRQVAALLMYGLCHWYKAAMYDPQQTCAAAEAPAAITAAAAAAAAANFTMGTNQDSRCLMWLAQVEACLDTLRYSCCR
jgi:hypothetical protein